MGYNSVILICNDVYDTIDKDPAGWWRVTKIALSRATEGEPVTYGHGSAANGFVAVSNAHADEIVLIAAGGNYASVLDSAHRPRSGHSSAEDQLDLLKHAANELGYRLVKQKKSNLLLLLQLLENRVAASGVRRSSRWLKSLQSRIEHLKHLLSED